MIDISIHFDKAFQALSDHAPMEWQRRMYTRLMQSRLPLACDLPTGLGKTSVIPIWLIALASQAGNESITLPRRLIYIVNRRTVVDQATDVVEQIRNRLLYPNTPSWQTYAQVLARLANELRKLSAGLDNLPLAISTLRGELADNEEWKADPARPAIIVGTIDMIGSKLLFNGYADGKYHRTHHAGLAGQDSLIVHDEAHLTPAFSDLLRVVAETQRQAQEKRPVRVLELSATGRRSNDDTLGLQPEDENDEIVQQRLDAKKILRLQIAKNDLAAKLIEMAWEHETSSSKVLIYVRSPELAQEVVDRLGRRLGSDSKSRVALLTGTIRGYERDRLARENPIFQALLKHGHPVEGTVYLVSTSAGEVGIDLDADHLVCDLTTLDSMIQRFGRVNRRGGDERKATVEVVVERPRDQKGKMSRARWKTEAILRWRRRVEQGQGKC
jgi:CRISPR-associated endonuclease/helicase Cas3